MIKRFVGISVLLLCLCLPAFGGHVKPSGAYCSNVDCSTCFDESCDMGGNGLASGGEIKDTSSASPQGDVMAGLFMLALTLFMAYRLRL